MIDIEIRKQGLFARPSLLHNAWVSTLVESAGPLLGSHKSTLAKEEVFLFTMLISSILSLSSRKSASYSRLHAEGMKKNGPCGDRFSLLFAAKLWRWKKLYIVVLMGLIGEYNLDPSHLVRGECFKQCSVSSYRGHCPLKDDVLLELKNRRTSNSKSRKGRPHVFEIKHYLHEIDGSGVYRTFPFRLPDLQWCISELRAMRKEIALLFGSSGSSRAPEVKLPLL